MTKVKVLLIFAFLPFIFAFDVFAQAPPALLSWQDNSGNDPKVNNQEDNFIIERSDNKGAFKEVGKTGPNIVTYSDGTVFQSVGVANEFCYRVIASNKTGISSPSNVACKVYATLPAPQTAPLAASGLTIAPSAP